MDTWGDSDEFTDADIEAELERELAALGEITAEEIAEAQKLLGDDAGGSGYLRPRTSYGFAAFEEDAAARSEQERTHACEEARLAIASLSGITIAPLEDAQLHVALPTPAPAPRPGREQVLEKGAMLLSPEPPTCYLQVGHDDGARSAAPSAPPMDGMSKEAAHHVLPAREPGYQCSWRGGATISLLLLPLQLEAPHDRGC